MEDTDMAIEKFNETLTFWMTQLDLSTLDQLLTKPDESGWSLGQVYEHLIEESNWSNDQIEVSLTDIENANVPMTAKAKKLFEDGSFPNKRILGDPLIAENVKKPISVDQLKSDLEKLKNRTNEIWKKMKKRIHMENPSIPGMGYLNCFEWLQYSEMHMRHHLKQKGRIEIFLKRGEGKA